ncbi:MAG: geranylgeranylglycerol-phosphate geranylgeranyltransferase [Bacteroidetes bacterium]|nr:geranylgeranylglycerol-phosphate geranylgeranyltransferase [Bacteroidota bacterium]MDA0879242.1 geranylgeranylglycerol-phosphate geranylgeranyltransferase [Bacteroidota bacterium]MDA1114851.1 geranylgeranylglycerol-phosphate geranylgeranyltransferase [Bacteroidota bacterium]
MPQKRPHVLLKFFSLFSVVRGYNILLLAVAQYLAAIYMLDGSRSLSAVFFDYKLMFIVLSSATAIAAGYIINNFYDRKKDFINRPQKAMIDSMVSDRTKLLVVAITATLALGMASLVSYRALLFFGAYIVAMCLYSAFLRRFTILSNMVSSFLVVTPFLAITIYYRSFDTVIFVQAIFLLLILSAKKIAKDLKSIQGDLTANLKTIPVRYGVQHSKNLFYTLLLLAMSVALFVVLRYPIGKMIYFFILSILIALILGIFMFRAKSSRQYWLIDNAFKMWIVIGVCSLALYDATIG